MFFVLDVYYLLLLIDFFDMVFYVIADVDSGLDYDHDSPLGFGFEFGALAYWRLALYDGFYPTLPAFEHQTAKTMFYDTICYHMM